MPTIDERKESRYWTKEQVGPGKLFTIKGWHEEEVGNPPELKDVLDVVDSDKPIVLNWTRKQQLADATGTREQNEWAGHVVVAFNDPTVMMGAKKVGGIAFRAPKPSYAPTTPKPNQPKPRPAPAPAPVPEPEEAGTMPGDDDSIPF